MDTPLPFPGLKFIPLSGWFFFAGSADSQACHTAISDMLMLCHALQAPLNPEKVVHQTNCITFLGIELDTVLQQARLPTGKLTLLLRELKVFSTMHHEQHTCTKHQLLSLIGKLAFARSQAYLWVGERDKRHLCALRCAISRWKGNVSWLKGLIWLFHR